MLKILHRHRLYFSQNRIVGADDSALACHCKNTKVSLQAFQDKVILFAKLCTSVRLRNESSLLDHRTWHESELLTHREMRFCPNLRAMIDFPEEVPRPENIPMLRHIPQPLHARGLEADVGIDAAGHGSMDDGLLLLVQQRYQFLFGSDVAPDSPVRMGDKTNNGRLFWKRRERQLDRIEIVGVKPPESFH